MDAQQLATEWRVLFDKFLKASEQVRMLSEQLRADSIRLSRADKDNKLNFLFNIHTRIDANTHARKMYYVYTIKTALRLNEIQREIIATEAPEAHVITAELSALLHAQLGPLPDAH